MALTEKLLAAEFNREEGGVEHQPAADLYAHFGITAQRVVNAVRTLAHRRETWVGSDERGNGPLSPNKSFCLPTEARQHV